MIIQLVIFFTLIGIAIGSFLNVCIDRLPTRKSLVSPPSHRESCQRRLGLLDLVPILSKLILRGRCRYCGTRIPIRVLLVEFLAGLIFFLAFWRFGLSAQFGVTVFWCCVFLVIIFIDWEHKLILNVITYPAIIIAIAILAIHTYMSGVTLMPPEATLINGLISAAILFVFFLLIGIVIGGIVAIILLATGKKGRKDVISYGTFLGIGPIVALIFAPDILNWYLSFF